MFDDLLLLISGNDIPFPQAQMNVHQPTLKEIGYIGEENFFTGLQILTFSKKMLSLEDKVHLEDQSDFDIFIAILKERNAVMQKNRNCALMVLALLFPQYTINIEKDALKFENLSNTDEEPHYINNINYEDFKKILAAIFDTKKNSNGDVNPSGPLARKIAEKLKKRQEQLAKIKGQSNKKVDIISRQASILAIALNISLKDVLEYTIYQLFDQIERYQLQAGYDIYVKAKMAGATDMKEPEDWMQDIHSEEYLYKNQNKN